VRPIDPGFVKSPKTHDFGAPPMLEWVPIRKLVVDDTYQRPIRGVGKTNVKRIAAEFCWSSFAPAIIAPIEGGRFAIVDGQHRITAAAACGFDEVPCQIIVAAPAEQAAAFKAVNGNVTIMSRMAIHAAAVAAGDPSAMTLDEACRTGGVTLLRYPVEATQQKPGQTHAVAACAKCLAQYGRETLITALQCVTQTDNNLPGMLTGPLIKALCEVLAGQPAWRDAGERLLRAFDEIDLVSAVDDAGSAVAKTRGLSRTTALVNLLRKRLAAELPVPVMAVPA
jgi:hypothetical protein